MNVIAVVCSHAYDDFPTQVAVAHGSGEVIRSTSTFFSTDRLAEYLIEYAREYQPCYFAVETNEAGGYNLVRDLYDRGMAVWEWKRVDENDATQPARWLGWETNARTKPILEAALGRPVKTAASRCAAIAIVTARDPHYVRKEDKATG